MMCFIVWLSTTVIMMLISYWISIIHFLKYYETLEDFVSKINYRIDAQENARQQVLQRYFLEELRKMNERYTVIESRIEALKIYEMRKRLEQRYSAGDLQTPGELLFNVDE